jgi:Fe-S-cluster containining protein
MNLPECGMTQPCDSCHAGCCRAFAVPVSGADILRLVRETGRSPWDFVCRWADPEGRIAGQFAPTFHFDDEPATPFVVCLRMDESALFPGTRKCVFLSEEERTATETGSALLPVLGDHPPKAWCSVHKTRPGTCRAFPLTLSPDLDFAVLNKVPANGRGDGNPAYDLCPRAWTTEELDPLDHVADLVVARYEMQYFHSLARSWNRKPGPWSLFPEFLKIVYGTRIQAGTGSTHPAGVSPATGDPVTRDKVEQDGPATLPFPESGATRRNPSRRAA